MGDRVGANVGHSAASLMNVTSQLLSIAAYPSHANSQKASAHRSGVANDPGVLLLEPQHQVLASLVHQPLVTTYSRAA